MADSKLDDDLRIIFAESRLLAIAWKHGFINYDHLFVAMLKFKKQCMATSYLDQFDVDFWSKKICCKYRADGKETLRDSIPLTKVAVRILQHCRIIAHVNQETVLNTIHLLLALLCFENDVSEALNLVGIVIEDITASHFKETVKRFPRIIKPLRKKRYNRVELFILFPGARKKEISDLYQNANDLFDYRQFEDSIITCQVGLSLSTSDINFKRILAFCYLELRDFETALVLMKDVVELSAESSYLKSWLSYLYNSTGDLVKALEIIDKLLMQQPDNDMFLNQKGFFLMEQERYLESIPFFEKAIEKNPAFAYPVNNLGFAKFKLGETEIAMALIDKSLCLDKGNAYAYKNKAIIFIDKGNGVEALKNFNFAKKYGYNEKYGDDVEKLMTALGG